MVIINGLSFSDKYQGLTEYFYLLIDLFFFYHVEVAEILDCFWIRGMAIYWWYRLVLVPLAGSSPWSGWWMTWTLIPGCLVPLSGSDLWDGQKRAHSVQL